MGKKLVNTGKSNRDGGQAEIIEWNSAVNKAIADLAQALINPSFSIEEIADIVLKQARNLTESNHGYVSAIEPNTGDMIGYTLTKMMGKECLVSGKDKKITFPIGPDGLYPGLWGHSLNTQTAFYTNSPQTHKACRGTPEGHIPIKNFLSVPALVGEELVGQIACANSAKGYKAHHAEALSQIGKLYAVALQRKRAEENLRQSEQRFRALFEQAAVGVAQIETRTGRFLGINRKYCDIVGYSEEEMRSRTFQEISHPEDLKAELDKMGRLIKGDIREFSMEKRYFHKNGSIVWVDLIVSPLWSLGQEPIHHIAVAEDITARKNAEKRQQLAGRVLECLNRKTAGLEAIRDVVGIIKESMGFAAVGIRLKEGDDFPYLATEGFSEDFIKTENYLCAHDESGRLIYDSQGLAVLECMCGFSIRGFADSSLSFFTEGGSFWTNNTTRLVRSAELRSLGIHLRSRCNEQGYESVALIPLRAGEVTVGLLQLNEKSSGAFTLEVIRFFERIGDSIGIAISRIEAEEQIKSIAKFPSENPNLVLRIGRDGKLLYANDASSSLVAEWSCSTGEAVPENWRRIVSESFTAGSSRRVEIKHAGRVFAFMVVPVVDGGYVNLYARDITERKAAEEDLEKHRRHLKELVETRTKELSKANKQLMAEIEERKKLEREILDISERERRRLGDEIHDSLGQQLTGIAFMTKVLERKLTEIAPKETAGVVEISRLVEQATEQARGLARGLNPLDLGAESLPSSLEELARQTRELIGVNCSFKYDQAVKVHDRDVAVHLYRIVQEAVNNAIKHGRAKNIGIILSEGNNNTFVMTIKNDGRDFPKQFEARGTGMGLQIMDHRVDLIGGSLNIHAPEEGGAILTCTFPKRNG
ncbi:MAG TPA: PAS domain S-box protein [Planctomycetes bacterium]|nr:PAS domain S-box protein [Planctomycetota bacterium]HIJ71323.1 PAS domain S-box protein [Planctomycetota bacterium]